MSAFSVSKLDHLREVMSRHVDAGLAPGLVLLLGRGAEVHAEILGAQAAGKPAPMRRDTIFRIASMTKPITSVAALMLVEECKLRLDEPVDRLLPELANRRVLRSLTSALDDTVPARRPITLRDLLTFTAGFGLVLGQAEEPQVVKAANDLGVQAFGPPHEPSALDPDEWLRRFATLPLLHQPGRAFRYHTASEVLGVLIARAAGQPLETFLRERILGPLGMVDTGFHVPQDKLHRLADLQDVGEDDKVVATLDDAAHSQWSRPPPFPSAGGGLVSTADDYLAFGRMLKNRGVHEGRRLLSRLTVEALTTDQLTPEQKSASPFLPGFWNSNGWGLGVSVITRRDGPTSVPGRFGWDGIYGTSWTSDPAEDLVGVLMVQRYALPYTSMVTTDFWTSAYAAIE